MGFVSPGRNWSLCHPHVVQCTSISRGHVSVWSRICWRETNRALSCFCCKILRFVQNQRRNAHLARWGRDDSSALWGARGDKPWKVTIVAGKITTSDQRITMTRLKTSTSAKQLGAILSACTAALYGRSWPFMTVLKHSACEYWDGVHL